MKVEYYPNSDMLAISLRDVPATGGGEDVADGVVFSYDDEDRIVFIEIDNASKRVDLTDIKANPAHIVDDSGGPILSTTVTELAEEWGLSTRTIQKTIRDMKAVGMEVGKQHGPTFPIILYEKDVAAIERWRAEHPQGRPKVRAAGG